MLNAIGFLRWLFYKSRNTYHNILMSRSLRFICLLSCLFLYCNADIKIGNKHWTSAQLKNVANFLNSDEIQSIYQVRFHDPMEYIFDLEVLKLIAKRAKITINMNYMNRILNILPTHEHSKDLATYITLSNQIKSHYNVNNVHVAPEIIVKTRKGLIKGFIIWKIANKDKIRAIQLKAKLENAEESQYKVLASQADNFVEYKTPVMSFQLSPQAFHAIKMTIKNNFSDIILEDGEYVFFYLINTSTIDENDYFELLKQKYKDEFLHEQIRLHRSLVSVKNV